MKGDKANVALPASRNALSGKARSAVQAHTVFGGVHMYDTPVPENTQRIRTPAGSTWTISFLVLLVVVLSLVALLSVLRRVALPVSTSSSAATSHRPKEARKAAEDTPEIVEMPVPSHREGGRQDYLLKIPEIMTVHSFQAYQCGGRVYPQVLVGVLRVPKRTSKIASAARAYGDNFARLAWRTDAFSTYGHPRVTSRSSYGDGSVRSGVQLFGVKRLAADVKCEIDAVMIGVLALDCGHGYCLVVVLVGADRHSPGGLRQAAKDVRCILDGIVVDFGR
jgi:hypothetical protein